MESLLERLKTQFVEHETAIFRDGERAVDRVVRIKPQQRAP